MVNFNAGNAPFYYPAANLRSGGLNAAGATPQADILFGGTTAPANNPTQGIRPQSLNNGTENILSPDLKLNDIAELTPERLKANGIKGVIFDLDDTLMPLGTGQFPPEAIQTLKHLNQAGIKVGIVSNNPSDNYTEKAQKLLADEGLNVPFIKDARKPASQDYKAMMEHLGLSPKETAMVGDSRISDMIGGNSAGMTTIEANWYNDSGVPKLKAVLGDIGGSLYGAIRSIFNPDEKAQFLEPIPVQA